MTLSLDYSRLDLNSATLVNPSIVIGDRVSDSERCKTRLILNYRHAVYQSHAHA